VARSLGHDPVLLPAHDVKLNVLRNKTDRSDARALLEAHRNADLFPVPVKTMAQQALTALHRTRSAWMTTRTARINLVRGVLCSDIHDLELRIKAVEKQLAELARDM